MAEQRLAGHYGREVLVDRCGPCRLVWFDTLESVNLAPRGWLGLLRGLQQAPATEAPWDGRPLACPVCAAALKPVHNLSRFGRFAALECPNGHGHLQSFALLLAERGLVRPLLPPERAALATARRALHCLNCGAPVAARDEACSHCGSPLVMIDLPRLVAALLEAPGQPLPAPQGRLAAWHCAGCGQALDPTAAEACGRCGQLVVVPTLAELRDFFEAIEAEHWKREQPVARQALRRKPPREREGRDAWRETGFARIWRWFWRE